MGRGAAARRARHVVIVGAGSAGCVLAARLAEESTARVTLLEAGHDLRGDRTPGAISGSDALAAAGLLDRVWPNTTVARVSGGEPSPYVRGRGVGGSGVVNGMIATLGSRDGYDAWARAGVDGWSSTDLERAAARIALDRSPAARHEIGDVDATLLAAIAPVGRAATPDAFGFDVVQPGSRLVPLTRRADGRRSSVVDAYLEPARARARLEVRSDETVERIVTESGRAVGVVTASGDHVDADEVVLCAGAIHTPALLLASGIGPEGMGPPAVGVGVQDHPAVSLTLRLRRRAGAGRLAMCAVASVASGVDATPDLQIVAMNRVDPDGRHGALVLALLDVQSRGRVTGGPNVIEPRVDLAQLSDERDLDRLTRGVLAVVDLVTSGAFADVADAVFLDERGTPLEALGRTHDDVAVWLRANVQGLYHVGSSCRMGPVGADSTVVDPHLRVVGVGGLRVCDASVFPRLPATNPHLPVVLVAERAAELLIDEIRQR